MLNKFMRLTKEEADLVYAVRVTSRLGLLPVDGAARVRKLVLAKRGSKMLKFLVANSIRLK